MCRPDIPPGHRPEQPTAWKSALRPAQETAKLACRRALGQNGLGQSHRFPASVRATEAPRLPHDLALHIRLAPASSLPEISPARATALHTLHCARSSCLLASPYMSDYICA